MKVLIISTFEQTGGAARSAHRLYRQISRMNVSCRMLVQYKQSNDSHVLAPTGWLSKLTDWLRPFLDAFPILFYRIRLSPPWSLAWLPSHVSSRAIDSPDIIHLHGIGHGFLSLDDIAHLNKPLVWTLHDSWAFTGGCHLPGDCERFIDRCGCCPQLNARHERDLSRWGWHRKATIWPRLDVTFVTPSRWLARLATSSSLLSTKNIDVLPNGVDTTRFVPCDRNSARSVLGLPHQEIVLLYGASVFTKDSNKGFNLLLEALRQLLVLQPHIKLVLALFGDPKYKESNYIGIPIRSYGRVTSEERLVALYSAADIFVLPSLQENLPNTVMESMACGTPCVAFDVGGVGDLISHGINGYLAKETNGLDLAEGIAWMLADPNRCAALGREARKTIETSFCLTDIAARYLALYDRILANQ